MNTKRIRGLARLLLPIFLGFHWLTPNPFYGESAARPEPPDWFAGDAHVHRGIGCGRANEKEMLTPQQLLEMMKTNNLAVISVLTDIGNGEIKYAEKDIPLMTGRDDPVSTADHIVHWDAEWHYDPEGVTFQRKVIGGHLILLGLKQGGQPFAQYTYPIFEWAKSRGAIGGYAHMQYLPFAFYPPPDGILQSLDCCAPLEYPVETALGSSSFLMEDVHGSDSAIQAYYRILNCGFRPGLVASTDYSCNYLEPLGTLLTYVRIPGGKLTYAKWVEGIAQGKTVVSRNAHNEFLDLKVNETAQPGDEVRLGTKGPVRVRVEWRTVNNAVGRIEVVQNGSVVASQTAEAAPGSPAVFETTLDFRQSGWLAARRMDWQSGHQTHTGAVFVVVKGQPIRASASDAEFFVQWIDNLIRQTSPGGAWSSFITNDREAAQARYRKARAIFEERAREARNQAAAKP
ncbi:MAG TPA: CehA/McbA family metallohydrolase [Blastocatellia bacterium]|nr:CehA/McbA family metallohydrolase [Blastocatellia bacterium]